MARIIFDTVNYYILEFFRIFFKLLFLLYYFFFSN